MLKDHSKLIHRLTASTDVLLSAVLFVTLLGVVPSAVDLL
jgi:hypothetical protein